MKKFISLLLCVVILLMPMTVFATDYPEETLIRMGDVNLDGKVNASDARCALRISAKLDSEDGLSLLSVDADGNGKISSADARLILRNSAGLSEFTYGFDGNGLANSIKAVRSGVFSISVSYDDMKFEIIKQGENIHIIGSDMGADMATLGMEDCGIMLLGGKLYLTYVTTRDSGKIIDVAAYIPEDASAMFEMSADDVRMMADDITNMFPDELSAPEKIEENGEVKYVYNTSDGNSKIIVDAYGIIQAVGDVGANGKIVENVVITDVSAEIANNHFDINRFDPLPLFSPNI